MPDLSKLKISVGGKVVREGKNKYNVPVQIIYLDDHKLFRSVINDYCIKPFYVLAKIIEIENGDMALAKVEKCIAACTTPDLIITDINHPGLTDMNLSGK
ncbi:MAG: hypothetical protein JST17_13000 [Bacteroidetes bacterium]|nr:hypothetical protein [Bacteroidota bacterium]MBS1931066.1 hypothetical protein [Bacteroidota bacterium]